MSAVASRRPGELATAWEALDLTGAPADGPVAFHDDLDPHVLLAAYRHGLYPFPAGAPEQSLLREITFETRIAAGEVAVFGGADPFAVAWCSPDPRPVITAADLRIQRSLRQQLRNKVEWTTTADACFERVVRHCRASREPRWLTDELVASLCRLHEAGHAHSVEVWDGDVLVGGTFGVRVGAVFSADSQFHLRSGAAKVAVADLARRFAGCGGVAVDVQHDGPHARLLGARPMPRPAYLQLLRTPCASPAGLPTGRLPARTLAG